ncbi:MAG TPA: hypothetical protein VKV26_23960 [Dehalococcoidia bacterium]|nr:hypothetical protein [Dehalococcoidia bacterium]
MIETNSYDHNSGGFATLPDGVVPKHRRPAIPAYARYVRRQRGQEEPDGWYDGEDGWYPVASERRPCCERVRTPSRDRPY